MGAEIASTLSMRVWAFLSMTAAAFAQQYVISTVLEKVPYFRRWHSVCLSDRHRECSWTHSAMCIFVPDIRF